MKGTLTGDLRVRFDELDQSIEQCLATFKRFYLLSCVVLRLHAFIIWRVTVLTRSSTYLFMDRSPRSGKRSRSACGDGIVCKVLGLDQAVASEQELHLPSS